MYDNNMCSLAALRRFDDSKGDILNTLKIQLGCLLFKIKTDARCIKFSLAYVTGDDTLGQITINYSQKCSHSKENLENAITNVLNAARVSKKQFLNSNSW